MGGWLRQRPCATCGSWTRRGSDDSRAPRDRPSRSPSEILRLELSDCHCSWIGRLKVRTEVLGRRPLIVLTHGAGDGLREPTAGAVDGEQPQTIEHYDEVFAVAVFGENLWYAIEDSGGPLDTDDVTRENFIAIANQQRVHVDTPSRLGEAPGDGMVAEGLRPGSQNLVGCRNATGRDDERIPLRGA